MRPILVVLALALAIPCCARPKLTVDETTYQLVTVDGKAAGRGRVDSRTVGSDDAPRFETKTELSFRLQRLGTELVVVQKDSVVEDGSGKLLAMRTDLDMAQSTTVYEGVVEGAKMRVSTSAGGAKHGSTIDWSDDVPGPRESCRRLAATRFAPGAKASYFIFQFAIGPPLEYEFTVEGDEEVELPLGKRKLHRIRARPEEPSLPEEVHWVDDSGETLRTETSMIGMKIVAAAATREQWEQAGEGAGAEVFTQSLIRSNVRFEDPRALKRVVYRLRAKDGKPLELPEDERQHWIVASDGERRLEVIAVTPPGGTKKPIDVTETGPTAAKEFLEPNALIQSDDPRIVEFARATVGAAANTWRAAQLLERAVNERVKAKGLGVGFASAAETFEKCEGDCSEHAVLLAACCRALGIPARVAMGIVYVDGVFGGHAWTEVWIDGRWYGLDATIGKGSADPTHVRMGASSLADASFGSGFLGVVRNLGNLELEVLEHE